jgi:hypothetical protein
MSLVVKFAIYGALPGGASNNAEAFDVTQKLQALINANGGIVACNNNHFGDPAFGNDKHFGALVTRNGSDFYFACDEGQTIDFNHGGGPAQRRSDLVVKFAVYGALPGGNLSNAEAFDVTARLQDLLNQSNGPVACNNQSFGDPAVGNTKHFAAVVTRNGRDLHFACQEGQVINFRTGGE